MREADAAGVMHDRPGWLSGTQCEYFRYESRVGDSFSRHVSSNYQVFRLPQNPSGWSRHVFEARGLLNVYACAGYAIDTASPQRPVVSYIFGGTHSASTVGRDGAPRTAKCFDGTRRVGDNFSGDPIRWYVDVAELPQVPAAG